VFVERSAPSTLFEVAYLEWKSGRLQTQTVLWRGSTPCSEPSILRMSHGHGSLTERMEPWLLQLRSTSVSLMCYRFDGTACGCPAFHHPGPQDPKQLSSSGYLTLSTRSCRLLLHGEYTMAHSLQNLVIEATRRRVYALYRSQEMNIGSS
jgi:hypothetical protein